MPHAQTGCVSPQGLDGPSAAHSSSTLEEHSKLTKLRLIQKKHMLAGIRKRSTFGIGHGHPFVEDDLIEQADEQTITQIFNQTMPHLNSKFVTASATPYKQDSLASRRLSQKRVERHSTPKTMEQDKEDGQREDDELDQSASAFGRKVPSPNQLFKGKSKRQQLNEWMDFERRSRLEKSSLNAMTENSMAYLEQITDAVRAERRALLFEDL